MRQSVFTVFLIVLVAAVLAFLGTWQIKRLNEKNKLNADIKQRIASKPVALSKIKEIFTKTRDVDYYPVIIKGKFLHDFEQHYYTVSNGESGWNIFTPMLLENNSAIFVNRGFVTLEKKQGNSRIIGQISGNITIKAISRNATVAKPNVFMPENDLDANIYYWRSLNDMIKNANFPENIQVFPFFVDISSESDILGGPKGGTTRLSFPNNHLHYALTWYGLCISVVAISIIFYVSRRRRL